ncbi:hypothetical protein FACS1894120_5660 [Clostridia bacterium]|nr:hypothetical protein FACS1894120_5660 [Clostridia bacterium]
MKKTSENAYGKVRKTFAEVTKKISEVDNKKRRVFMSVVACAVLLTVFADTTPYAEAESPASTASVTASEGTGVTRTVRVKKGTVRDLVSVTGKVKSVDSENVYSYLPYQVQKILHDTGDKVEAGDVLAVLDTDDLEYDVRSAKETYQQALNSSDNEQRSMSNAVVNAQTNYEQTLLALQRQQLTYDNAVRDAAKFSKDSAEDIKNRELKISNAKLGVERAAINIRYAEDDLKTADHDLAVAKKDLDDARKNFKPFKYDNALTDAQNAYNRAVSDLAEQRAKKWEETDEYVKISNGIADARTARSDAKISMDVASALGDAAGYRKADASYRDANDEFIRGNDALAKAEKDYRTGRKEALLKYERAVTETKYELDRAKEAKSIAVDDWNEAQDDSADAAQKKYDAQVTAKAAAVKALDNAKRAQTDAKRTYDDALIGNDHSLKTEKAALENAKLNVVAAQNSLAQAKAQEATTNPNSALINVEKLEKTLYKGTIKATMSGTVTENNAKVGANPAGVMFVIEDTDRLYVSANVKEYVVGKVKVGQKVDVKTDATGDDVLHATVTYISPKSVATTSGANTSVEYEVRAELDKSDSRAGSDPRVRIGMNGFIDIIISTLNDTLYIPTSAILTQPDGDYVFVANTDTPVSGSDFSKIKIDVTLRTSGSAGISGTGISETSAVAADPDGIQALLDNPPPVKKGLFGKKS